NHEWLSEVALGVAYRAGGPLGLVLLKMLLVGIAMGLIALNLRRGAEAWRWSVLAMWGVAILPVTFTVRPQLWTLLLLVSLLRLLPAGLRAWWGIPPLFVLWANVHGGWVLGLGVLGAWMIGRRFDPEPPPLWSCALVCLAALG